MRAARQGLEFVEQDVPPDVEFAQPRQGAVRIATRVQRQQFWTEVMKNPEASLADRLRASELLGKSEADFVAKVQHEGTVPVSVIDPYAEPGE